MQVYISKTVQREKLKKGGLEEDKEAHKKLTYYSLEMMACCSTPLHFSSSLSTFSMRLWVCDTVALPPCCTNSSVPLVFSTEWPYIITHTAATTPKKKKIKTDLASCYQQVGMCQIKENEKNKIADGSESQRSAMIRPFILVTLFIYFSFSVLMGTMTKEGTVSKVGTWVPNHRE